MSISVSGGGELAVTTESLLEARRSLERLRIRGQEVSELVGRALDALEAAGAGAAWLLRYARRQLDEASYEAERLSDELWRASEAYGWAERAVLAEEELVARVLGPAFTLPQLALAFAVNAAQHEAVSFGDPRLVAALRATADSLRLPPLLALVRALPGPVLEETEVTAVRADDVSTAQSVPAPAGFADLAGRIPPAAPALPQLRIERYELPGGTVHWIVYSAGTVDWSVVPGAEPWDDTSNVVGLAGGSAGSTRAALAALRQAGWQPGEAVLPVGHSQGGIVAMAIATSGVAPVPMLVTFGSPTAGVRAPRGVVELAVEHSDDPVPVLGGSPRLLDDRRLLVREDGPAASDGAAGVPSHAMSGYQSTAERMDGSSDQRLIAARARLAEFTGGEPAEVTMWRGERVRPARGG